MGTTSFKTKKKQNKKNNNNLFKPICKYQIGGLGNIYSTVSSVQLWTSTVFKHRAPTGSNIIGLLYRTQGEEFTHNK